MRRGCLDVGDGLTASSLDLRWLTGSCAITGAVFSGCLTATENFANSSSQGYHKSFRMVNYPSLRIVSMRNAWGSIIRD